MGLKRAIRGLAPMALLLLGACFSGGQEESAVARGDEAWAAGAREEALAEYRLAVRQGSSDPAVRMRVAHAFTALGRVDEAREHYVEAIDRDPRWSDQAVSDLLRLARRSEQEGDRFRLAQAMQLALELQPGISVGDLAGPLARHFASMGDYRRAIPFFQRALPDASGAELVSLTRDLGVAHEQVGDCGRAIVVFERYRRMIPTWEQGEVNFQIGSCAFALALDARQRGDDVAALENLDTVLDLGEPRAQLGRVWFEVGEVRASRGECEAALQAFGRVAGADGSGNSPLVNRARDRIDEIRFGSRGRFSDEGC